jgi:hypothetical protein
MKIENFCMWHHNIKKFIKSSQHFFSLPYNILDVWWSVVVTCFVMHIKMFPLTLSLIHQMPLPMQTISDALFTCASYKLWPMWNSSKHQHRQGTSKQKLIEVSLLNCLIFQLLPIDQGLKVLYACLRYVLVLGGFLLFGRPSRSILSYYYLLKDLPSKVLNFILKYRTSD